MSLLFVTQSPVNDDVNDGDDDDVDGEMTVTTVMMMMTTTKKMIEKMVTARAMIDMMPSERDVGERCRR